LLEETHGTDGLKPICNITETAVIQL